MSDMDTLSTRVGVEAFRFGDPEPVLDHRGLMDYLECAPTDLWYEPPLSLDGLARAKDSSVHHASALVVKRNILASTFVPHRLLSRSAFSRLAMDYLVFGNCYLEQIENRFGQVIRLQPAPAKYVRRGLDLSSYWWVPKLDDAHQLGRTIHLMEPDINQEVYGLPDYLAGLQSALLNESATLFRRRYYLNGSHAGFILHLTDSAMNQEDVDAIREAMRRSKGPGNFRNLFLYTPNGTKDSLKVIPVAEVAAKDEFLGIKNATRDDVMAMHRVPPQLMCVLPNNTGGFGDVEKSAKVFWRNEQVPLQERFREVNDLLGIEVMKFLPYQLDG